MDKVVELLGQLAEKLGQTVEALWPHAVRYVVVDGLVGVAFGLVMFGLSLYVVLKLVPFLREEGKKSILDQSDLYVWAVVAMALCAVALPVALFGIFANLPQVFEPVGYLVAKAVAR